jgi:hypothetical protein
MIENQAEEQQEAVEDQFQIEVTEDPVEPQAQGGDDELGDVHQVGFETDQ